MSTTPPPPPTRPDRPRRGGVPAEIRDAVSLRTFVLVTATLALGLGFVVSYVGALLDPRLQNAPVTVVSNSPKATAQLVADFNGVSLFYLVVGWSVTGYLIASILGLSAGSRPATLTRAVIRLVTPALCGFLAGLIGTLVVQRHVRRRAERAVLADGRDLLSRVLPAPGAQAG